MDKNKNYRKPFNFINNALFTPNNIPLSIDDTEKIIYFNPHTRFTLTLGTGVPAYTARYNSSEGTIYITSHRLIYRPSNKTPHFDNFAIAHSEILRVEEYFVEIKVEDERFKVMVNFEESQMCFYEVLRKTIGRAVKVDVVDSKEKERLPLYCEVVKKEKDKEM